MKKMIVVALIAAVLSCKGPTDPVRVGSAGVIVSNFCKESTVRNNNAFPVVVEQIWVDDRGAEETELIFRLEPGEIKHVYVLRHHRFYIYLTTGVEVGSIRSTPGEPL